MQILWSVPRLYKYSPLNKVSASELIKWLVGFWMDAMAWRAGWTPSVIHTQQYVQVYSGK